MPFIHRQRQQGFTLIEIVAAFAILAIGLALSMSIASGALSQVRRGTDFTEAALNAKSKLDSIGAGTRLEEGTDGGEFDDGSRWELEVSAYEPELVSSGALSTPSPVDMYYLRLTVFWNEGRNERQATFSTLRTLTPDRGALMRAMRSPATRQSGFTLLEILLASTLLAILLTLAYSTISGAVRTTRSGEAQIERTDEVRVTQEFLRRQLSHAMPVAFEEPESNGDRKVFEADGESLRFVAPMPGHLSRGGLHVQWLELARGRDGYRLDFDHHQLNGYDPDDPKGDDERPPVTLLDGIADASFEYRELDEQGELGDWDTSWDDMEMLPVLVRLNVRFENENRSWPLFEVPMKLAAASASSNRFRARRPTRPSSSSSRMLENRK